jgi:hypothetical protein
MKVGSWLKSNIGYGHELLESGIAGADAARRRILDEGELASDLTDAAIQSWKPAVAGALLGAAVGFLCEDRKTRRGALLGGVIGASVGFIGGAAWESRRITGILASSAMKEVNTRRDSRFLEENPIDYA